MNIMTIIILLSLLEELPELPEYARANRRAARETIIARNKAIASSHGWAMWYAEEQRAEDSSLYFGPTWKPQHVHYNKQDGRFAEPHFGGHRRLQKRSHDYYPSLTDEKARRRWNDELKDYFNS